jgi:hypothetical protein
MNLTRSTVGLTAALALVVLLGACGDDSTPVTSTPPTTAPAPAATPVPAPTPTPAGPTATGFWDSEARRWHFRLEQQGTNLTGSLLGFKDVYYPNPEDPELKITGINAGGQVDFHADAFGTRFSGTMSSDGRQMTGTLRDCANGCRNYGEVLVRQ